MFVFLQFFISMAVSSGGEATFPLKMIPFAKTNEMRTGQKTLLSLTSFFRDLKS